MAADAGARPRVLHVLEALGGGTSRHLIDIARHVDAAEHVVAVPRRRVGWLSDDDAVAALRAAGARVELVEMRRSPAHPRNAVALAQVRRLIGAMRADVVHGHSSIGGALARLAAAGKRVPVLYTPNAISPSAPAMALERALARLTTRFIAVSESEGEVALRLGLTTGERLAVVRNGVDIDDLPRSREDLRQRLGLEPGTPLVGTLSRLVAQKNPLRFVEMCARASRSLPDVHFVLVGDGVQLKEVTAAIAGAAMGPRFHHVIETREARGVVAEFDVFVSASDFEGAPYTPLDAMLVGVPVVLTDVAGNHDIVEDGVSGMLAAPGARPLADAVVRLMRDPGLRRRTGEAGRRRVVEHFDIRRSAASLGELYRAVVASNRSANSAPIRSQL